MPIQVICPGCHTRFKVSDKFAGKTGPCPKCKATLTIPKLEEEVVIHAPEQFGPKDKEGRGVLQPIARKETKVSTPFIVGSVAACLLVVLVAFVLGRLFRSEEGVQVPRAILSIGAVLLAPPLAWAGYAFLRNEELDPYTGNPLVIRLAICSVVYALLWGVHAIVCDLCGWDKLEIYQLVYLLPILIVPGAVTSLATLDLDGTMATVHYVMYLGAGVVLRLIMGMTPF